MLGGAGKHAPGNKPTRCKIKGDPNSCNYTLEIEPARGKPEAKYRNSGLMAAQGEVNNKPNKVGADSLASALPHATAATLTNIPAICSLSGISRERRDRDAAALAAPCASPLGIPAGWQEQKPSLGKRMRGCWKHRLGGGWRPTREGNSAGERLCSIAPSFPILPCRGAPPRVGAGFVPWIVSDTPGASRTCFPVV